MLLEPATQIFYALPIAASRREAMGMFDNKGRSQGQSNTEEGLSVCARRSCDNYLACPLMVGRPRLDLQEELSGSLPDARKGREEVK